MFVVAGYLGKLLKAGLVDKHDGSYTITEKGCKAILSAPWFERT
jgi:predicted transcriptional regulator